MRVIVLTAAALAAAALLALPSAVASHTPNPTAVTIAGSLQSELGCTGDWDPGCTATHLLYDAGDDVWQATFPVPAGAWEYKAALNGGWDENYGLHAAPGGANIGLDLGAAAPVKFYYDHKSHWITDNRSSTIAVAPGSFQSELGCPGDWDPGCLRSWLQDADGDGVYTFETTALPAGDYEGKVAIGESWDENYGVGGIQNGPNIAFHVPATGTKVSFRYDAATHVLTIRAGHSADGNVEWDGLRHDSRDRLYRTPGGAVPAGTPVLLRFRTFHDDVTGVAVRLFDVNANAQRIVPMERVASDVSCYQADLAGESCDFWQARLANAAPDNLWYRFVVTDGSDVDYYGDDSAALDGGAGAPTEDVVDRSYALTVYDPAFTTPAWARDAVVYQIFPDRFRNGNEKNDPKTGDTRYDDPVLKLSWGTLPEGYCRNYSDANTSCPWRFDATPPSWSPTIEGPRGRDYFGGDLPGVEQKLDYLRQLGITTIYFNPIFTARSNHRYDTASYRQIDPALGTLKDFTDLVAAARARGMRIVLDGVFNHMSSDSPFFDRYHHYADVGACESLSSPWRSWFVFHSDTVPCGTADYEGWFGFDSIPVLAKSNPAVQDYFVRSNNSISRQWLARGAAGWRLDVMGDSSFPDGYWEAFRSVVKAQDPNALIVGELWPKDTTTLRFLRGDRADSTMNYRLRDAVLGLLAPQSFDGKGLGGGGQQLVPSQFAARLLSIQEDYAPQAFATAMNLIDSHDTERALWTLTPGGETAAAKAAGIAQGKQRLRLASLLQFTVPGMPTVYYGDEVGVTGDDDPDDRRTFPWPDTGGTQDGSLLAHYQALAALRSSTPALRSGSLAVLAADDAGGTVAYGRKTGSQAAVVAVNASGSAQTLDVPVGGFVPDGTAFAGKLGGGSATATGGVLHVALGALAGEVWVTTGTVDLAPPAAPAGLHVTAEGNGAVSLAWNAVSGAASYAVYRSPVEGGGFVRAGTTTGTSFDDTGRRNAQPLHYVVTALDAAGNESAESAEAVALPHLTIGWANTQWPPTLQHTISTRNRTGTVYGQVWIDGATSAPGPTPSLLAQLGFGPAGSNPAGNAAWTWVDASFNVDAGSNDEFQASLLPEAVGAFDYLYRYSTTNGRDWLYADLNGPVPAGSVPASPGKLTVSSSGDTTPPATPAGLHVTGASPSAISLAWAADPDADLWDVYRGAPGGPYAKVGRTDSPSFSDSTVVEDETYGYVVRAIDLSFNRSAPSAEAVAKAEARTVAVVFDLTVPASTDATGRTVNIAGTLDRLDPPGPQWDPAGQALTRVSATEWTLTVHGKEGTQLEYKYTLGDWEHVEKDGVCGELANRQLTLSYGATGTQTVAQTVDNWRNVAPCGN